MPECTDWDPHTVLEEANNVSCNNLLSVIRVRDQSLQSMEFDIMFIISDRDPS